MTYTPSSSKRDRYFADTIGMNNDVLREARRIKAERRAAAELLKLMRQAHPEGDPYAELPQPARTFYADKTGKISVAYQGWEANRVVCSNFFSLRIGFVRAHQHADGRHLRLLRSRRQWPRSGRAAEQRYELASM